MLFNMNRQHYHELLDAAFNNANEGEFFLPEFVKLILDEQQEKIDNFHGADEYKILEAPKNVRTNINILHTRCGNIYKTTPIMISTRTPSACLCEVRCARTDALSGAWEPGSCGPRA